QRPGGGGGAGGAHVEIGDDGFGKAAGGAVVDHAALLQALAGGAGEDGVFGQAHVRDGGMAQPVLGGGQQPGAAARLGALGGQVVPVQNHGAGATGGFARQRGDQFL